MHWSLFLSVQMIVRKHWLRQWIGTEDGISHYLNKRWLSRLVHMCAPGLSISLRWRQNGHNGVSNHQPRHCLLNVYSGANQRTHQSSASLAVVRGIHRGPMNSPHKWPVTRKMFPFDDVIMSSYFPVQLTEHERIWKPEANFITKHIFLDDDYLITSEISLQYMVLVWLNQPWDQMFPLSLSISQVYQF